MAKDIPGTGRVPASQVKLLYLTAYNFASAVLWTAVLGRTAGAAYLRGPEYVPIAVGSFVRWTQTMALLEVVHSLLGEFCGARKAARSEKSRAKREE